MEIKELALDVKNITKKRGRKTILDDVTFSIEKGEVCGFVGRNGAGKTTLMKIITNMLFPDKGEVIICGKKLQNERKEALKNVGAVIENPDMYGYMTGRQNLNYIASVLEDVSKNDIENVIQSSGLGSKIDEKVSEYSLGMKQRLGLAQALMGNISLLILDEPTNGLDPMGAVELKNTIHTLVKEKGVTVFISSHILSEIESICSKVVFIDDGKIISVEEIGDKAKVSSNLKTMFIKTNLPRKASEIIKDIPDVKLLKVDNEGISILINKDMFDIFEIVKDLHEEGINIESFFEIKESLEDKFVKMMGDIK